MVRPYEIGLLLRLKKRSGGRVGREDSVLEKSGSWISNANFFLAACDSNGGDLNIANRVMLTRGLPGSTFACGNLADERARRRAAVCKRKVIQGASGQFP